MHISSYLSAFFMDNKNPHVLFHTRNLFYFLQQILSSNGSILHRYIKNKTKKLWKEISKRR